MNKFKILLAIGFATPAFAGNGVIVGNADDWYINEKWSTGHKLELVPAVATSSGVTHGALVFTNHIQGDPSRGADIYLDVKLKTVQQLRTGSAPNPWEVGWVTWNGKYDTANGCNCYTFNYFVPKTNGWELGMVVNNGGVQGQIFLATGSSPTFPINTSYDVEIYHSNAAQTGPGDQVKVEVNGVLIVTYNGATTPFRSGWAIGLYDEDSKVDFTFANATRL